MQRHFPQRDAGHALRSVFGPGGSLPSIQGKGAAKLHINVIQSSVSPFCFMTSMYPKQARGVRENYREAMYIGLAMGFAVCIMTVWVLAGLMTEKRLELVGTISPQNICSLYIF